MSFEGPRVREADFPCSLRLLNFDFPELTHLSSNLSFEPNFDRDFYLEATFVRDVFLEAPLLFISFIFCLKPPSYDTLIEEAGRGLSRTAAIISVYSLAVL